MQVFVDILLTESSLWLDEEQRKGPDESPTSRHSFFSSDSVIRFVLPMCQLLFITGKYL
jgi:hypothetical protein